jgi:hypothetical protein
MEFYDRAWEIQSYHGANLRGGLLTLTPCRSRLWKFFSAEGRQPSPDLRRSLGSFDKLRIHRCYLTINMLVSNSTM